MSIPAFFMQIAKSVLDAETFDRIHVAAVAAERRQVENKPVVSAAERVDLPIVAAKISAHLSGNEAPPPENLPDPHVTKRIRGRFDIEVDSNDLAELAGAVKRGGPNVKLTKTEMHKVTHSEIHWRGKHFIVIYDVSRGTLITAMPKRKKRKPAIRSGRPRREQPLHTRMREQAWDDD